MSFRLSPGCDCCQDGCCTNPDEPIFEMDFSSPDGLHPVSFTNAPLRVAKYTQPAFPIVPGFDRQPPSNLQNGSCPWPGSSTAEWFEAGSRSVGPDVKEDCCWAAIAIPSSYVASTPLIYKYRWSFESTIVNDKLYRSTFDRTCTVEGFEWQGSTRTTYIDTVEKRQRMAQRYLFAVGIKACFIDGQTHLTARVWYKDWERFLRTNFYRERFISSGASNYTGLLGNGTCGNKTDIAASDTWVCGNATRPTEFTYVDGLAVENCFDCNSFTVPNFSHNPANCSLDYVDRTIVLDSEICDISGTYVFESGLTPSVKFAEPSLICPSTITDCTWLYRTPKCPVESAPLGDFPFVEINETKPLVGNVDFDEYDEVQTVDTTETTYEDGPLTLMNWWTEDWTITIR